MAGSRNRAHDEYIGTWLLPLPQPDVKEGGESMWEEWHEAARELDAAFLPTLPSEPMPLLPLAPQATGPAAPSAEALMVLARHRNRVCPRPAHWTELYIRLGGDASMDLPPPPVGWMWGKLSAIQKRLLFREYLEWAERHHQLPEVALFMAALAETDWLHMGED
jgi:hypothetical protein